MPKRTLLGGFPTPGPAAARAWFSRAARRSASRALNSQSQAGLAPGPPRRPLRGARGAQPAGARVGVAEGRRGRRGAAPGDGAAACRPGGGPSPLRTWPPTRLSTSPSVHPRLFRPAALCTRPRAPRLSTFPARLHDLHLQVRRRLPDSPAPDAGRHALPVDILDAATSSVEEVRGEES